MNPSTSIVAINRIIDVSTSVQGMPSQKRDFKNTVFVWKGEKKGANRINYVGTDLSAAIDTYGSNSEVIKAMQTFLAGGFNGSTPKNLYVANINADSTEDVAAGQLVWSEADKAFTPTNLNPTVLAMLQERKTANELTYVSLTNAGSASFGTVVAYLMLDADNKIQAYLTKSDYITNKPIDFGAAPYSLADNDAQTVGVVYSDPFADAIAEILGNSTVYLVCLDNTFSETDVKLTMGLVEASTPTHYLAVLDASADGAYKDKLADTTSYAGYANAMSYKKTAVIVDDADKVDQYKSMSYLSYYAQVNMTAASPMGSVMFKTMSGITGSQFNQGGVITATQAWDNITGKNANAFAIFSEVYDTAWAKGTSASGHQTGDIIAADFVDYQITYELFYMLRSVPKLPCNAGGAARIEQCMSTAFRRLLDAGVIGPGVAEDGEVFGALGCKVYAEVPTGTDKALGVWNNVTGVGLLSGTTTKVIVQNTLKY